MVLAKPFSNEVLIAAVDKVLASDLSASELRYRRLFQSADDGILIVDAKTRKIVDVNPFLEEFLGYPHRELLGKELFEIGLLEDKAANVAAFAELQAAGHIRYENLPLKTKDGRCVDVEFVSNVYQEGGQQVVQCNVRDISARKKIENGLRVAELKLARHAVELEETVRVRTTDLRLSNTQLETFVHSVAHDLRAPLRTMQGFSELLVEEHSASLNEESRHYTRVINKAAHTMNQLLADLLAFSQTSQQEIELVPIDLEALVQSALSACETEIRESNALIECVPLWPVVLAHETTLRQALVNLIGNAVKYVKDKTPQVRLRAEERPGEMVRIWVEDNGVGVAPEFQERIFLLFQRLHTTEFAGTGIGLAIVQKGVERMGGHVGLVSALNEGSRFWIDLHRAPNVSSAI